MITSRGNSAVRGVIALNKKSKERDQKGLFVIEGIRMYREVPEGMLREVYISGRFKEKHPSFRPPAGVRFEVVADDVFETMSDTKTPQGIIAVVSKFLTGDGSVSDFLTGDTSLPGAEPPLIVALENLQDPGNLGTIFRSAEAAGATGILMDAETCDVYNPKVVRATMGAIFRVPFIVTSDLKGAVEALQRQGTAVYAAHLKGSVPYTQPSYRKGTVFLIGNEGNGLTDEMAMQANMRIRIPMKGKVESFNASVAASVLLFEAMRQRN